MNDAEFTRRWNGASSPSALAGELGVPVKRLVVRAARLRRRGVDLKHFPGGVPGSRLPAEDFVAIWDRSGSTREVAERLGTSVATVNSRVKRLRDKGVTLARRDERGRARADHVDLAAVHAGTIRKGRELAAAFVGLDPARLPGGADMPTRFAFHLGIHLARVRGRVPLQAFRVVEGHDPSAVVRSCRYVRRVAAADSVFARKLLALERRFSTVVPGVA